MVLYFGLLHAQRCPRLAALTVVKSSLHTSVINLLLYASHPLSSTLLAFLLRMVDLAEAPLLSH